MVRFPNVAYESLGFSGRQAKHGKLEKRDRTRKLHDGGVVLLADPGDKTFGAHFVNVCERASSEARRFEKRTLFVERQLAYADCGAGFAKPVLLHFGHQVADAERIRVKRQRRTDAAEPAAGGAVERWLASIEKATRGPTERFSSGISDSFVDVGREAEQCSP